MESRQGEDGRIWNNPIRKKLSKRAKQQIALTSGVTPKELQKTPSQKRSESGRRKLLKRAGVQEDIKTFPSDCRGCVKECKYDHDLERCPEMSLVLRCRICGQKVRFRIIHGVAWEYCPVCAERKHNG